MTQIVERWRLKLLLYGNRNTASIPTNLLISTTPVVVAVLLSRFNVPLVLFGTSVVMIHIGAALALLILIHGANRKEAHAARVRPVLAVLYSLNDQLMLLMLAISISLMGISSLDEPHTRGVVLRWTLISAIPVFAASIFICPLLLKRKIGLEGQPSRADQYVPLALSLGAAIPGIAVLASALLEQSGRHDWLRLLFPVLCVLGSMLLIPFVVFGIYENVVLVRTGWPIVEKSGAHYVVSAR
jgi:hypothetical protein